MYYIGLDVASKSSYAYVVDGRGEKIEGKEIPTDRDSYRQYFTPWAKKPAKVAVEAGLGAIAAGYMIYLPISASMSMLSTHTK